MTSHLLAMCDAIPIPILAPTLPSSIPENEVGTSTAPSSGQRQVEPEGSGPQFTQKSCRARLVAAVGREVLKLGNSKAEKSAMKDFVKVLSALTPTTWLDMHMVCLLNLVFFSINCSNYF